MAKRKSSKSRQVPVPAMEPQKHLLRAYIDPASISAGVALFRGPVLVASKSLVALKSDRVFVRLHSLSYLLDCFLLVQVSIHGPISEVHIEQLVRNTHIYTHWSVGLLGCVAARFSPKVDADVPISSWQKYSDWHGAQKDWVKAYKNGTTTEDELAAICMGVWHNNL